MQDRTPQILDALYTEMTTNHSYTTAWYVGDDLTNIARPYGVIDEVFFADRSYQSVDGGDHLVTLHYYEDTARACAVAMEAAQDQLHGQTLTLASGSNYCTRLDDQQMFLDGTTEARFYHGIQSWRILTSG